MPSPMTRMTFFGRGAATTDVANSTARRLATNFSIFSRSPNRSTACGPCGLAGLVSKRKRYKTKRFAFDELQLRRRRPIREKPPSPSHDEGLDDETVFIDQIGAHQRMDQSRAAIDDDVFARLVFELGDFFDHIFRDDRGFLPRSLLE